MGGNGNVNKATKREILCSAELHHKTIIKMKNIALHGILAGIFGAFVNIIIKKRYCDTFSVDFNKMVNVPVIIGTCLFITLLASIAYHFFSGWLKKNSFAWFNSILVLLSYWAYKGPFSTQLQMDIESPELFISLNLPMHFFPILFWIASKPWMKYAKEV